MHQWHSQMSLCNTYSVFGLDRQELIKLTLYKIYFVFNLVSMSYMPHMHNSWSLDALLNI